MSNKYKILIIEDEANICNFVKALLQSNGYQVILARNGDSGKLLYLSHRPDLVILDLGLPDMDGMELIQIMKESDNIPIIVLSARNSEQDKVKALDAGANDYVTKPFGNEELLARVRAALRVSNQEATFVGGQQSFQKEELYIDYAARQVTMQGEVVKLTQTEYNIVALLAQHAGTMMTYGEISKKVWGEADFGSTKKLQVNMANIRKKLGILPGENPYITNELGVGYRMN